MISLRVPEAHVDSRGLNPGHQSDPYMCPLAIPPLEVYSPRSLRRHYGTHHSSLTVRAGGCAEVSARAKATDHLKQQVGGLGKAGEQVWGVKKNRKDE